MSCSKITNSDTLILYTQREKCLTNELLAKITFLQEAPKMEIAKLIWYKELVFY